MITSIFIYTIGLMLSVIALLPNIQLWPEKVFLGIDYVLEHIMGLNNILLVVPELFNALEFFLKFLFWFSTFMLIRKVFNYLRGTGQGI